MRKAEVIREGELGLERNIIPVPHDTEYSWKLSRPCIYSVEFRQKERDVEFTDRPKREHTLKQSYSVMYTMFQQEIVHVPSEPLQGPATVYVNLYSITKMTMDQETYMDYCW